MRIPPSMSLNKENPNRRAVVMLIVGLGFALLFLLWSTFTGGQKSSTKATKGVPIAVSQSGATQVLPGGLISAPVNTSSIPTSNRSPFNPPS